jgi:hypothetical protein
MQDFFHPRGVISTGYILPAAAIISCGAKLHDYKVTGEEPCIRMALKEGGKTVTKTIFQFQEVTSKGEPAKKLLAAYKQLDFGESCTLPDDHILRKARLVLNERNRLHLLFQQTMTQPIGVVEEGYITNNTRLAATLSCLGYPVRKAVKVSEKAVAFVFTDSKEIPALAAAFLKPWGQYDFHEDHPLYHMRGALENRESLIVLLNSASVRVEIKQGGKRFYLPLNASTETLTHMVGKLNQ